MIVDIPNANPIACICEGGAETAIMNTLLDNSLLTFDRSQLIDESVLPRVSVNDFQKRYLRQEFEQKIYILRVIDSRSEQFNIKEPYSCQVEKVINVITAPEIEILLIVSEGKYDDFQRSNISKPSDYCKNLFKHKNIKSQKFVSEYFENPDHLVGTIRRYHHLHKQKNNEASLYDLLKTEYR